MCRKIVFEICRMRATNESRVLSHARYVRPAKIPLASGNSGITGLPKTSSQFLTRQLTNTTSDGCAQREQIRDDRTQRPVAGAAMRFHSRRRGGGSSDGSGASQSPLAPPPGTQPPPTPPAPTVSLSAAPTAVNAGGSTQLAWSSTNASACTANGAWSGTKATSGNQTISSISVTSTYGLICTGTGGSTTRSVTVSVNAPPPPAPTVSLSAAPTTVAAGGSTLLTWSSSNASSCTASGAWSGVKVTSGNETINSISAPSTYTLTCTGNGGATARSATVNIAGTAGVSGAVDSSLLNRHQESANLVTVEQ